MTSIRTTLTIATLRIAIPATAACPDANAVAGVEHQRPFESHLRRAVNTLDQHMTRLALAAARNRRERPKCQSALDRAPLSASKRDPFERRVRPVALAPSELAGVAETERARACA